MYEEILENENPSLEDLKRKLRTEHYAPSENGDMDTGDYYNPGVEMYEERHNWTENGWDNVGDTGILSRCPEYLPTDTAINKLISYDHIIEIGSGNGYWSHVINENGGECVPTDISPRDVPYEKLPGNPYKDQGEHNFSLNVERPFLDGCESFPCNVNQSSETEQIIWDEVRFADHTCVKNTDADHVLLCHPVKNGWTENLLDLMIQNNQKLVLVAQWEPSPDATPRFFLRLHKNWKLKDQFSVIDWSSMHAHGYLFYPPKKSK